jgi:hypothetical protein
MRGLTRPKMSFRACPGELKGNRLNGKNKGECYNKHENY